VAIAGSHGKTTTTSMAAHLLAHAGLDPTAVVGGKVNGFGSNAKLGKGDYMVVEADESDGSFLRIPPTIAIVTPTVQSLLPDVEKRVATYGESHQADYRAEGIEVSGHAVRFNAFRRSEPLGAFEVAMVGRHNALNALSVIALGDEMGIPPDVTRGALKGFQGVQRRFTVRGEANGVTVVDDYGHHPAEVKATLLGAREAFKRRVVCCFQPHRYTRTRDLLAEFATAFNDADVLLLTDVYAAGEEPIPGADAAHLADAIRACGHRDVSVVPRPELARTARERVRPGDIVLTLGAGDVTQAGPELLALLEK
jgi:UDP-N-acetylmuramate--alanine ligase